MGGKKREKNCFPETHVYRKQKNDGKNRLEKVRKHVFYIHTNIVTKNGDKKMHETIFPQTQELCELKILGKKSSVKSAKKTFFIFTRIS